MRVMLANVMIFVRKLVGLPIWAVQYITRLLAALMLNVFSFLFQGCLTCLGIEAQGSKGHKLYKEKVEQPRVGMQAQTAHLKPRQDVEVLLHIGAQHFADDGWPEEGVYFGTPFLQTKQEGDTGERLF